MLRVIIEAQPTWVLAENVAGLINMALDEVLADLEAQDYATGTLVVPACSQNALHRRDRVWIIARNARDSTSDRSSQIRQVSGRSDSNPRGICADVAHSEGNGLQGGRTRDKRSEHSEEVGQWNQEPIRNSAGSTEGDVAHSKCQPVRDEGELRERQRIWTDPSECSEDVAYSNGEGLQGLTEPKISGGERQQQTAGNGLPTNTNPREPFSRLGGAVDGLSAGLDFPRRWGDGSWEEGIPRVTTQKKGRTQRLKSLGNSIVPQVAYQIIRQFD
jgi:DNA (cytosine-5)-methyltransferase 1